MKLPKIIYVMGMPGAGKGTQAEMLASKIGYHDFSTGSAMRKMAMEDTELGRNIKSILESGYLAPPELAAKVVLESVPPLLEKGLSLVFDGTPRTADEAVIIDEYFEKAGYGKPLVIFLEVEKETMIERNSKRRFCLDIEEDFPIFRKSDEKKCEVLGGRIGIRPDDERAKFMTRYNQFMELTYPAIVRYKDSGLFFSVDGLLPPNEVHEKVMEIISTFELPEKSV